MDTQDKWYEDDIVRFPIHPSMRVKRDSHATGLYEITLRKHHASAVLLIDPDAGAAARRIHLHQSFVPVDSDVATQRLVDAVLTVGCEGWKETAYESVARSSNKVFYTCMLTQFCEGTTVCLDITGEGEYAAARTLWQRLAEGMTLGTASSCGTALGDFSGESGGALGPSLLDPDAWTLPDDLSYLQVAIKSLESQSGRELDSGESNLDVVMNVLDARFAQIEGQARRHQLIRDAEQLSYWAQKLPSRFRKVADAAGHLAGVLQFAADHVPHGRFS